ncbi:hypothetical protein [Candidatus Vondammii sp. HM_W22]|uniref:hypothetical protein n=1 Tax=Candidatus Vondammii sp. HM_W22 TaxID=2687299 RepID=UPI001F134803|nr:hypothetical protein [Candidatus Vondammii sp. HM_W22]
MQGKTAAGAFTADSAGNGYAEGHENEIPFSGVDSISAFRNLISTFAFMAGSYSMKLCFTLIRNGRNHIQ